MKMYDSEQWEDFLLKLRYQKSDLLKAETYTPLLLDDPAIAWLVYTGTVDVFSVALTEGQAVGTRQHLFTVENGRMLFGSDLAGMARGMVLMQSPDAQLLRFDRATLTELTDLVSVDIAAALVDEWLLTISALMSALPPKEFVPVADANRVLAEADEVQTVRVLDGIHWVKQRAGVSVWGRDPVIHTLAPDDPPLPLNRHIWLTTEPGSVLDTSTTLAQLQVGSLWPAFDAYQQMTLQWLVHHALQQSEAARHMLQQRIASDATSMAQALHHIAATLTPGDEGLLSPIEDPLLAACGRVAAAQGITLSPPAPAAGVTLRTITQANGIPTRQVALQGDWWQQDQGALLAYREDDRHPVALLPTSPNSYVLHDPVTGRETAITEAAAAALHGFGVQFYPPLTEDDITPLGLLRFGLAGGGADLWRVLGMGGLLGLLNLSIPLGVVLLFARIIPGGEADRLIQITLLLVAAALAIFVVQMGQRIAVLRLESRAALRVIAAAWDRLMRQKPVFFRQYAAGDLGERLFSLRQLRLILGESVSAALISSFVLLFNLILLVVLHPPLAVVGLVLLIVALGLMVWWSVGSLPLQTDLKDWQTHNSGMLLQLINGVRKFRVAGAEKRVFARWAAPFTRQRQTMYDLRRLQNRVMLLGMIFPLFALIPIFLAAQRMGLSLAIFAAFHVAFTQMLRAGLDFGLVLVIAMMVAPAYEAARPLLEAEPEHVQGLQHPGELQGEIDVSHVSFRYHPDQPLVLDDVSFTAEQGTFVAIVGASGSGKSTLLRLLLGFETPETGAVYYDGQDMKELDVLALRQQLGVVLQNAKLLAGMDLFKNIVGFDPDLTLDDAWEAAEQVGLADDIRKMPMGMQTLVTEGGGTLSGGQQQRLLIAAAIVRKPRLIYFDEATSALDNRTQQVVSESLEMRDATRIVIAHRLSTIINADKIIVLNQGRVVQQGTYQQLIREPGIFADMARRQMV